MNLCHCGSASPYDQCCRPYIEGAAVPSSAEALMRSRYSAYVVGAIDYLGESLDPDSRSDWDKEATRRWAEQAQWQGLEILSCEGGGVEDSAGVVEFVARFSEAGQSREHRERSRFIRREGLWFYLDGEVPKPQTARNQTPKVGRNHLCPCGSGRKYKKCCAA